MSITEVRTLPLRDKLQIMEEIRDDMRQRVDELDVPASHRALLDSRRERVRSGTVALRDWDEVKHGIGRA